MPDLDVRADSIRITVMSTGHLQARDGGWWKATWDSWETFLVMYDTSQKLFVRASYSVA
jgi:hypothetical protein